MARKVPKKDYAFLVGVGFSSPKLTDRGFLDTDFCVIQSGYQNDNAKNKCVPEAIRYEFATLPLRIGNTKTEYNLHCMFSVLLKKYRALSSAAICMRMAVTELCLYF